MIIIKIMVIDYLNPFVKVCLLYTSEHIVKGEPLPTPGIPESFNVLLHELRGLGLSVNLI